MPVKQLMGAFLVLGMLIAGPILASSDLDRADAAVADVLFGYDGSFEFATYKVRESGHVTITFARNIPESLYSEILTELKKHQDINGVLAGRGGPVCPLFK
jgi:hypothetical protein